MRRSSFTTLAPLAAALLAAAPAAAQPAAQSAAAARAPRPVLVSRTPASADAPAVRTVATYRLTAARDTRLPTRVTVADSAGRLVATFRLRGDVAERAMLVEVLDGDLVLQGGTPAGPVTLRLFGQNDAAAGRVVSGHWWLGGAEGDLRGHVVR